MRFANGTKVSMTFIAHAATQVAGHENIQFVQSTKLPEPKLTTVLGDVIQRPIPTGGGSGTIVFNTEICRPVTTTICDIVQVTSTVTTSEVVEVHTSSVVTTSSQETSTVSSQETTTTTVGSITSSTGTPMTTAVSQTSSETPVPTSGGEKEADGAGILAGLALLLLI